MAWSRKRLGTFAADPGWMFAGMSLLLASVMSTPDQADVKILLFVDQRTTSAKLGRPQVDQNRVILTMSQVDGRWLVSKVEAF